MKYYIMLSVPQIVEVEAISEEDAKEQILNNLILNKQILPNTPITMEVVGEITT